MHCVHGFTAPEFLVPRAQADARRALGLPAAGKIVLVSGGGWGVGDVEGAVEEVLAIPAVAQVVCLCGRNEELREQLRAGSHGDRASGSRASPTRCPSGSRRPTRSSTRPAA